jgi:hypothetical protein
VARDGTGGEGARGGLGLVNREVAPEREGSGWAGDCGWPTGREGADGFCNGDGAGATRR